MASNFKYAPTLEAAQQDAVRNAVGNGGKLWFYGGVQPTGAGVTHSQTPLASMTMGSPFSPAATVAIPSVLAVNDGSGTAVASGTATWARLTGSAGTSGAAGLADFSVGLANLNPDIVVPADLVAGTAVTIKGWKIYSRPEVASAPAFQNGGFEVPAFTGNQVGTPPPGNGWLFAGVSSITRNASMYGPPNAPEGLQAALLQTWTGSATPPSIEQTCLLTAGIHTVTIRAAQRASNPAGQPQTIRLTVDGAFVGDYAPPSSSYTQYQYPAFSVAVTGAHTMKFTGVAPTTYADVTAFFDDVLIDYTFVPPTGLYATNLNTNIRYDGPQNIRDAVYFAGEGHVIAVQPGGTYNFTEPVRGNTSVVIKSAVPGQKFVIDMGGVLKVGIWCSDGKNLTVEDCEIRNNSKLNSEGSAGGNLGLIAGSGVGPSTIILRRCKVWNGGNGLKVGQETNSTVLLEDCEFLDCGSNDTGQTHNIYVDNLASFTMRGCWSHMSDSTPGILLSHGHLVKSRAKVNLIEGCRLTMEAGVPNRCIDFPNGGDCTVRGNLFEMNAGNYNSTGGTSLINFGVEEDFNFSAHHAVNVFRFTQNTIVNHLQDVANPIWYNRFAPDNLDNGYTQVVKDNVFGGFAPTSNGGGRPASYAWQLNTSGNNVATESQYEPSTVDNTFITYANLGSAIPGHATFQFALATPVTGSQNWSPYAYLHPAAKVARTDSQRGGVVGITGLGTGSAAGSYNATTKEWQPGFDAAGVVNAASWALVPPMTWVTVLGSKMSDLDTEVKQRVPLVNGAVWRDCGSGGWHGMLAAWNGLAIDQAQSRLWCFGGGHSDSSNNGLYRFDVLKMKWFIEHLPSNPAEWISNCPGRPNYYQTAGDGGTFTECTHGNLGIFDSYAAPNGPAINGSFYDELFWGDHAPTARHNYSGLLFIPDTNEIVMWCRRLWRYSLSIGAWTYKRKILDGLSNFDGENLCATYDEVTHEVLASAAHDYNQSAGYNLATNAWTGWNVPWKNQYAVADARHGRIFTVVVPPISASEPMYWRYDLDARSFGSTSGTMQYGGGVTRAIFDVNDGSFPDGAALCYVPDLNRYWLVTRLVDRYTLGLFTVDPTTTPWTLTTGPTIAGTPGFPSEILERRLIYIPTLHAVVLVNAADENIKVCRIV